MAESGYTLKVRAMIREIRATEMEAMLELYRDLHESDEPIADWKGLEAVWSAIIEDPKIRYFVVEKGSAVVSGCHLVIVPNLTRGGKPYGMIENVVTKKDCRHQGLARQVLEYALKYAWEAGCYKVMLMTGRQDSAVFQLYESVGFNGEAKRAFLAKPE